MVTENKDEMSRAEARFTAYQFAWSWVSEAANKNYTSDFYQLLGLSQMLDFGKLPKKDNGEWEFYEPNEKEIEIIKAEMTKLEKKLRREMGKIREEFNKNKQP